MCLYDGTQSCSVCGEEEGSKNRALGNPSDQLMCFGLGVDRLSAPILSILPIINIGHFKNRFADDYVYFNFFYANKHTIYR